MVLAVVLVVVQWLGVIGSGAFSLGDSVHRLQWHCLPRTLPTNGHWMARSWAALGALRELEGVSKTTRKIAADTNAVSRERDWLLSVAVVEQSSSWMRTCLRANVEAIEEEPRPGGMQA